MILPVRDGAAFIEAALKSVLHNLSDRDELIIVDDGSSDDTLVLAEKIVHPFQGRTRFIRGENWGPSLARNKGLEAACGDFITFIDHDDLWPAGRMHRHLRVFDDHPKTDLVVGQVQPFREVGGRRQNLSKKLHHVHLGASTFRQKIFDVVGTFNPGYRFSEDLDLFTRIRELPLHFYFDPKIALYYRKHETNMTNHNNQKIMQHTLRVLLDSIKRRRESGALKLAPFGGDR